MGDRDVELLREPNLWPPDTGAVAAALETVFAEYRVERTYFEETKDRLAASKRRLARLQALIGQLAERLPAADRAAALAGPGAAQAGVVVLPGAGTADYRALVSIVFGDRDRAWRVRDVQEELARKGFATSKKTVGSTLGRLMVRGALVRVGRGAYRALDTGVEIVTKPQQSRTTATDS